MPPRKGKRSTNRKGPSEKKIEYMGPAERAKSDKPMTASYDMAEDWFPRDAGTQLNVIKNTISAGKKPRNRDRLKGATPPTSKKGK